MDERVVFCASDCAARHSSRRRARSTSFAALRAKMLSARLRLALLGLAKLGVVFLGLAALPADGGGSPFFCLAVGMLSCLLVGWAGPGALSNSRPAHYAAAPKGGGGSLNVAARPYGAIAMF